MMSPDLNKENLYVPHKNRSQCVTAAKDSYNAHSNINVLKGNNLKANSETKGKDWDSQLQTKARDCESFLHTLLSDDGLGGKVNPHSNRSKFFGVREKDQKSYISKVNETFFTHQDSILMMHEMLNEKVKDIENKMIEKESAVSHN